MSGAAFLTTAQYYGSDVVIYSVSAPTAHAPVSDGGTTLTYFETLTNGFSSPQGTVVTKPDDWYIANTGDSNIPVYHFTKSGPSGPTRTLDDPNQYPVDVDSNVDESLVAVSNIFSISEGSGSISLYADGATTPTGTLNVADDVQGIGIALDKSANCYWSYNDLTVGGGYIVEFRGCTGTAQTIVSGLGFAGGLAFDKKGDLFYSDQDSGIYKCQRTRACTLLAAGFSDPLMINFDAKWQHLWVADAGAGIIYALDPATGAVLSMTPAVGGTSDPPFGIAPAPGTAY